MSKILYLTTRVPRWSPGVQPVSARKSRLRFDTLGEAWHGVQTAPIRDIPERARVVDDVLARLGLAAVHLVGASTGGRHAVNLAIHAPSRIASIAVLDPTTVTAKFSGRAIRYGLAVSVVDNDRMWRGFLRWSTGEDVLDRPDVRLVLAGIRNYRPRVPFQKAPRDDEIRAVRMPVLAMFGARSVVHDAAVAADRLRTLLPAADVELLPGAGHHLLARAEDRDRIVGRILRFVNGS